MIGGRILDVTAVRAFAEQRSVYASALVWTAVDADVVLLVPASVLAEVGAELAEPARAVLGVLLGLPVTVVDPLDEDRARDLWRFAATGTVGAAHAAWNAAERGWPLVTAAPARYVAVDNLMIEELP